MNINFFSPLLIILILTLLTKGVLLITRVQTQTDYTFDNSVQSVLIDTAYAQDPAASEPTSPNKPKPTKAPEAKEAHKAAENKPAENSAKEEGGEKKENSNSLLSDIAKPLDKAPPSIVNLPGQESINNLSGAELQLLKELVKRRKDLEKTQESINNKEQILKATEGKLDQKMAELKILQTQLKEMMKEYDQKENSKVMSLVKIYENMKPKEAAKIFDELEMPTLLQVVSNMKEVKVAPVLASMNPVKARDLSMELARKKTPK